MADPDTLLISCGSSEEIVKAIDAVMPQLAPDVRRRLNTIKIRYWQHYGVEGIYERVNNRTVSAILSEYGPGQEPKLIASGEVEGVRYEVVDAPEPRKERDEADDAEN